MRVGGVLFENKKEIFWPLFVLAHNLLRSQILQVHQTIKNERVLNHTISIHGSNDIATQCHTPTVTEVRREHILIEFYEYSLRPSLLFIIPFHWLIHSNRILHLSIPAGLTKPTHIDIIAMFGIRIVKLALATTASIALFANPAIAQEAQSNDNDCHPCQVSPAEFDNVQTNLDSCLTSKNEIETVANRNEKELQSQISNLSQSYKTCKAESAEIQASYNDALQKTSKLEESLARKSNLHTETAREFREQIASLEAKVEQADKKYKALQDKYFAARGESTEMEKELRRIRFESQRTYVNTTLILQDVNGAFVKYTDKAYELVEVGWNHPKVQSSKDFVVKTSVPVINGGKQLYNVHAKPKVEDAVQKMKEVDEIEGVRLTFVSSVHAGSKAALNYMTMTGDKKEEKKSGSSGGCRCGKVKKTFVRSLKFVEANSELVVNRTLAGIFVFLVWKIVLSILYFIFGSIAKILGFGKKKKEKQD